MNTKHLTVRIKTRPAKPAGVEVWIGIGSGFWLSTKQINIADRFTNDDSAIAAARTFINRWIED